MTKVITLPPIHMGREKALANINRVIMATHPEKPINVRLSKAQPERTLPQNKYLFGVAYPRLVAELGFTADAWHDYMLREHFGRREVELPGGEIETKPIRTTTTDENGQKDVLLAELFWQFVEFVQRWASEHGVFIPDPVKDGAA